MKLLVVFAQIVFRVRDTLTLKKKRKKLIFVSNPLFFSLQKKPRQIQVRQILASFSVW